MEFVAGFCQQVNAFQAIMANTRSSHTVFTALVFTSIFSLSSIKASGQLIAINDLFYDGHITVEDVLENIGVPDSLQFYSGYWDRSGNPVVVNRTYMKNEREGMVSETKPHNHNLQSVTFFYPDATLHIETMHHFPEAGSDDASISIDVPEDGEYYDEELYCDYYDMESFFITREGLALRDTVNNVSIGIGDPFQKLVDYVENAPLLSYDYMSNAPGMKGYDIDRIHSDKISELKYSDWGSNEYGKSSGFYPGVFSDVSFTAYVKDGVITAFSYFDRGEL